MPAVNRHRRFVLDHRDRYDDLLTLQGGRCAICRAEPKTRRLHIDHDHRTMTLRGLLCHRCNARLDNGVDANWLDDAYGYLTNPPALRL